MPLAVSPTPAVDPEQQLRDQLDEEISKVRNEIQKLTKDHARLSAALLSSTRVQKHIEQKQTSTHNHLHQDDETTPLHYSDQALHNETNIHRLAFGVTSFPFTDPAPENKGQRPLLGVRFDLPSRTGKFERAPYYIFLKHNSPESPCVRVHHHTIPAFVDMERHIAKHLPIVEGEVRDREREAQREDEGYYGSESRSASMVNNTDTDTEMVNGDEETDGRDHQLHRRVVQRQAGSDGQDLQGFVAAVRQDLVAHSLRVETISYLAECLNLPFSSAGARTTDAGMNDEPGLPRFDGSGKPGLYSVVSLAATTVDASFIRIIWRDGSLGRLKLADNGEIKKAVVVGKQDQVRLSEAERLLSRTQSGQPLPLEDLIDKLQILDEKKYWID